MKPALALQLLVLAYHQVTTRFDFYPFNGARFASPKERQAEAGMNFVIMCWPPVGFACGWPGMMKAGVMFYFVLLACIGATWFIPYFFGASPKWQEIYSRVQGRTLMVLPRRGNNPNPNLEHLILMALTLAAALASLAAYRRLPGADFHGWPYAAAVGALMVGGIAATHWRWPSPDLPKAT
ncbi:MAG TPA: hypothetical protein VHI52_13435 [Verrucomicrobiae bacterium]|nr:hypothetical protein [Verrucomicrobiae bacterium]HVW20279.1 hypothetical protein [Opitutaceae bacterium]